MAANMTVVIVDMAGIRSGEFQRQTHPIEGQRLSIGVLPAAPSSVGSGCAALWTALRAAWLVCFVLLAFRF